MNLTPKEDEQRKRDDLIKFLIDDTMNAMDDFDKKFTEINRKEAQRVKRLYLFGIISFIGFVACLFYLLYTGGLRL